LVQTGYARFIHEAGYGHYLHGFAAPRLVFAHDLSVGLPADLAGELQRRLEGQGCPVLAWAAHNMNPEIIAALEERLLLALGRSGAVDRIAIKAFSDGSLGYVIYVAAQGG
jgi:hypothetical protein